MINWKRLLKNSLFLTFAFQLFYYGCGKKADEKKFIARVNDAYLTEEKLAEVNLNGLGLSREEFIKKWIEKELLYQQAVKDGITDSKEFKDIMNDAQKELAASMLIQNYLKKKEIKPSDDELSEYYELHKDEMIAQADYFQFNEALFKSENSAIKFRMKLLTSRWDELIENYEDDTSIVEYKSLALLPREEIIPLQKLRMLESLEPEEISIVFQEKENLFSVIQLIKVYKQNTQLPFEAARSEVEARYFGNYQKKLYNEYLNELHAINQVEVK